MYLRFINICRVKRRRINVRYRRFAQECNCIELGYTVESKCLNFVNLLGNSYILEVLNK